MHGEAQKTLDVLSNEILLEANEWGGNLAALASEEMEYPSPIPTHYPRGEYLLLFDPLDGSSNIDVNISVGTIFSVLRCPKTADGKLCEPNEQAFLQPGRNQVAAGFAVYGPTTVFLSPRHGVFGFTSTARPSRSCDALGDPHPCRPRSSPQRLNARRGAPVSAI